MLKEIKKYNLDSKEYEKMEDIERLMLNETEHYDTAYKVGKKEGINGGISQGKTDRNIEIAKSMLTENIDIKMVSKITGLTHEEIESL